MHAYDSFVNKNSSAKKDHTRNSATPKRLNKIAGLLDVRTVAKEIEIEQQ